MYTSEKVRSISSTLPSLNLADLQLLKAEIESIIRTKNIKWIALEPTTDVKTSEVTSSKVYKKTFAQSLGGIEFAHTLSSPVTTGTLDEEMKITEPAKKPSRPLGIWKGQIEISEDFYKTSSDIYSEFGIEE
ncbi:hypothetical protein I8751_25110 [Nostocaceae cyanobacterium CENA357]|uniref:Uncharacterized protein n=1 Tax=Atlanticothrix silvestris CENA357 TaxID=1725252 RepID=A0A8J7HHD3_9CYAN|nr:hypothetical protein [Atlanticothrix silvestris]MBH8555563.1 hypothetical protein [Atlanticothrix silvestris CENA357]